LGSALRILTSLGTADFSVQVVEKLKDLHPIGQVRVRGRRTYYTFDSVDGSPFTFSSDGITVEIMLAFNYCNDFLSGSLCRPSGLTPDQIKSIREP
jgi:hypothetical protein